MKYLLTALSALLLLSSCSGANTFTTESDDPDAIVVSEADADADSEVDEAENAEEDGASDEAEDAEEDGASDEAEDAEEDADSEEDDTVGLDQKNVKLEVSDQRTTGQITVKKIATSRDGWVSIHQSKEDGSIVQPDSIGEARVDSGDSEDIIVDLWEAPAEGDKLWALLHIDAGERGTYEYPGKDAPVKKNGETMARSFMIKGEEKEDESDE